MMIFARQIQPREQEKNVDNSSDFVRESAETTTGACVCVRTVLKHQWQNQQNRVPTTGPLRANLVRSILESGTSAGLRLLLLTGGRADVAFLTCWVGLIQATKVQAPKEAV